MIENINLFVWDIVERIFANKQCSIMKLGSNTKHVWDRIVDASQCLTYKYISNSVILDECVMTAKSWKYFDLSVLIGKNGLVLAIWPFSIYENELGWHMGSGGDTILAPYVVEGCSARDEKTIYACCMAVIKELGKLLACSEVLFEIDADEFGIDYKWEKHIHECEIVEHQLIQKIYVDLTKTNDFLWKTFRKRYHSRILNAEKDYVFTVYTKDNISNEIWEKFKTFFIKTKGRDTKSEQTWKQHDVLIREEQSILIIVSDRATNVIVGGTILVYNKHHSYYMSGAYDKNHKNVGHFSQYLAIKFFKCMGVKWYYLGEMFYPDFNEGISEKELSISEFKSGFVTNMYWTCIYYVRLI